MARDDDDGAAAAVWCRQLRDETLLIFSGRLITGIGLIIIIIIRGGQSVTNFLLWPK